MSPINDDCESYTVAVIVVIATSVILLMSTYYKRWTLEDCNTSFSSQHHQDKVVAKNDFLQRVGSRYGYANSKKGFIDNWRQLEFPTLIPPLSSQQQDDTVTSLEEEEQEVYLDYAGSALPTSTLLSHVSNINTQILANPHSIGGGVASDRTLKLMQLSKDHVMKHFGIDKESFGLDELDNDTDNTTTYPGYQLVFTFGATDSLRLVSERFPWNYVKFPATQGSYMTSYCNNNLQSRRQLKSIQMQSILLYPRNVHTSVIGMREVALGRDAKFHCVSVDELLTATSEWFKSLIETSFTYEDYHDEKTLHESTTEEEKDDYSIPPNQATTSLEKQTEEICKTIWIHHLLVLPVECNFGGDRFDWNNTTTSLKSSCFSSYLHCAEFGKIKTCHKWHILLDTAKAAATSQVHLPTLIPGGPDFAVVSFYKMFGTPTGLGALFVKKQHRKSKRNHTQTNESQEACLVEQNASPRHFFGGGSVDVVLPGKDFVVARNASLTVSTTNDNEHIDLGVLEHGTQHFRGIASLSHGFQELNDVGGMKAISDHSTCLARELIQRISALSHDNGMPVVEIYGQWKKCSDKSNDCLNLPGPTIAFNVFHRDGSPIGYDEVSRLATLNRPPIQLRTGCFCNPGACQDAIHLTDAEVIQNYASGHVCGDRKGVLNGKPTGAVRASFGKDSAWEDMDALASFIEKVFVSRVAVSNKESEHEYEVRIPNITMKVDSIFIFPIKSCAAMRVRRWPIDKQTGHLMYDREFALVDTSGAAIRLPQMSQIHINIDLYEKKMTVSYPDHEDLILSLEDMESNTPSSEDVSICGILCKGNVWGGIKASNWFSSVLGVRCWLARHSTVGIEALEDSSRDHAYCNKAALLLVSQQSISYLNSVIKDQGWGKLVEARHFRPNIVVSRRGKEAKEQKRGHNTNPEDEWENIIIRGENNNNIELRAVGKCARCQMVDIDPSTGMKGNTLRALATYRRDLGNINFGTFYTGNKYAPKEESTWLEEGSTILSNQV